MTLMLLETKKKFWALKTIGKYFEGFKQFQKAKKLKNRLKSQLQHHFQKNLLRRVKNAWNVSF
jgi:centrosomal protein POC5